MPKGMAWFQWAHREKFERLERQQAVKKNNKVGQKGVPAKTRPKFFRPKFLTSSR